jgi:hypothetical protein
MHRLFDDDADFVLILRDFSFLVVVNSRSRKLWMPSEPPGVQGIETVEPGCRDEKIPASIANHAFDIAFIVALARTANLSSNR